MTPTTRPCPGQLEISLLGLSSSDSGRQLGEASPYPLSPPAWVSLWASSWSPPRRKRGRLYMGPTCTWLTSSRVVQQLERAWSGPSQAVGQDTPPVSCSGLSKTELACAWRTSQAGSGELRGGPAPHGLRGPHPAPALCSSSALQVRTGPKQGGHLGSREESAGLRASLFSHSWTLGPGAPSLVCRAAAGPGEAGPGPGPGPRPAVLHPPEAPC